MLLHCDPPRWPGGPVICQAANLPSFETLEAMGKFFGSLAAGAVSHVYLCPDCLGCHGTGHFHGGRDRAHTLRVPLEAQARNAQRSHARAQAHAQDPSPGPGPDQGETRLDLEREPGSPEPKVEPRVK